MKKTIITVCSFLLLGFVYSCSEDDETVPGIQEVSIVSKNGELAMAQGDTLLLVANVSCQAETQLHWSVDGKGEVTDSTLMFIGGECGTYNISLTASNGVETKSTTIQVEVYGKFKKGTFILNEGNMTTENGSLIFISPKGIVTDSAYFKVNGKELGNVTQDLYISDNKIYIISQCGSGMGGEGYLTVADAGTLKKVVDYNDALSALNWPAHVAVAGKGNVFIQDNNGVSLFNEDTRKLTFIQGSKGASRNNMAVVGNKVFVPAGNNVLVLQADKVKEGENSVVATVECPGRVSAVLKASDGDVWVGCGGTPSKIIKMSAKDYSFLKKNDITYVNLSVSRRTAPTICAKGDTLYMKAETGTKIFRHIFSKSETELMVELKDVVENAGMTYNSMGIHPLTGRVYANTIKGYGWDFLINHISVFNFSGDHRELVEDYQNYTHFPAGIYFTDSFNN